MTAFFEQFDFARLPNLNRALVHDLATGRYLHQKAPVLLVGPSGIGKSHLAQALGHCAVRQGVDVIFTGCAALTQSLNAARATGAYDRKLAALARVPLLIIDDFGLKPLRAPADEDLHDLIAERYERAATIVTSNLDFDEWTEAFAVNRLLASATVDRLRHNAYCLELDGLSYRDPQVPPASKKTPTKPPVNAAKQRLRKSASRCSSAPRLLAGICRLRVAGFRRLVTGPKPRDQIDPETDPGARPTAARFRLIVDD